MRINAPQLSNNSSSSYLLVVSTRICSVRLLVCVTARQLLCNRHLLLDCLVRQAMSNTLPGADQLTSLNNNREQQKRIIVISPTDNRDNSQKSLPITFVRGCRDVGPPPGIT